MIYTDQRSIANRPTQDNFALMNVKMRPEHRKAFRIKCAEMNLRMSDLVRNFVAEFIER